MLSQEMIYVHADMIVNSSVFSPEEILLKIEKLQKLEKHYPGIKSRIEKLKEFHRNMVDFLDATI